MFLKQMNLNFMNYDRLQEKINKKVTDEINKSNEEKVKQILSKKDTIIKFINSSSNNCLGSVLQCLLNI